MTHPLTNEICEDLLPWHIANFDEYDAEGMRSAADWQLEQVIKWIKECPNRDSYYRTFYEEDCDSMIRALKEAMRPQEDN